MGRLKIDNGGLGKYSLKYIREYITQLESDIKRLKSKVKHYKQLLRDLGNQL